MKPKVYTVGYSGRKVSELLEIIKELDAVVFDIRFSPRSRAPQWDQGQLQSVLGESYRHESGFGNRNYRGGPISLVNYEAGKLAIEASPKSVILMCVCKDTAICHRSLIAEKLRLDGFEVHELGGYQPAFSDWGFEEDSDEPIIGWFPPPRR